MPSFIDLYRADRAWLSAARTREDPEWTLASSEPLAGAETDCVVCGRAAEAVAVCGRAPVVIIVGRPAPPPRPIIFCDRCVHEYQLGPGVSVAEDLVNAWRTARGLPERDFSRF
jgi:hypothetical protein